jgi:hypothetical protein
MLGQSFSTSIGLKYTEGMLLFKLKQYQEAYNCFSQILQKDPNSKVAKNMQQKSLQLLNKRSFW